MPCRYFCQTMFQHTGQELADNLKKCMTNALRQFHKVNGALPERIVVYRDGVGDGQVCVDQLGLLWCSIAFFLRGGIHVLIVPKFFFFWGGGKQPRTS